MNFQTLFHGRYVVTQIQLRYTFRDVIYSRFKTSFPYTLDAALVAPSLFINKLEVFCSFFTLKTEVIFLEAVSAPFCRDVMQSRTQQSSPPPATRFNLVLSNSVSVIKFFEFSVNNFFQII